jgi:PAS domain S-box-containing protein
MNAHGELISSSPKQDVDVCRLLDVVPAAAYTCDADGLITHFNQRAAEVWGREPKLNDPLDRYSGSFKLFSIGGSPIAHNQCWVAKALIENKEYNGEEIVVERPDGSRRIVLAHANPLQDESGRVTGAVNVLVDITDQKKMEATNRMLGIERPRKTRLTVPMTITGLAMLGLLFLFEFTKQLAFPSITVWQSHFVTILFGTITAMLVAFVVLRKQAYSHLLNEQVALLHQNEEQLADFFENSVIALHWLGPDGVILRANQAELDLLGYTQDEYVGHHISEFHADAEVIKDILRRKRMGEVVRNCEARLRCKDGSIKYVLIDSNVKCENGQFLHTRCFTRNISDRKRMQEEIRKAHSELEIRIEDRTTELQLRAKLAELAAEVGVALAREGNLRVVLQECAACLVRHVDAAFARIWTLNESQIVLELQASAGMYTHIDGPHRRVPVGQFKIGLIAQERKPHLTNAVVGDPRVHNQEWATQEGMVAFAGYPLIVDNRVVGVMALFARHELPDATLGVMEGVASQIALGIERKQKEQEAGIANERFRLAAKAVHSLIFDMDLTTGKVQRSDGLFDLLGYHPVETEATGDWWISRVHPDDWPQARQVIEGAIANPVQQSFTTEYRVRHKVGHYVHVWDQGYIVRDQQRRAVRIVGNVLDLTDRKRARARLRAEHEAVSILGGASSFKEAIPQLLSSICLNLDWALGECWLVDKESGTIRCEEIWCHSPFVKFEEAGHRLAFAVGVGLPGRIWATGKAHWLPDLANDSNFPRREAAIEEGLCCGFGLPILLGTEVVGVLEFFGVTKEQSDSALLNTLENIGTQIGQFIKRRRAEKAVRQSEALKGAILDSALDGIITMDHQGNVVEFNAEAERMFGYCRSEAVGKSVAELIVPPELRRRHLEGLRQYLTTGESGLLGKRMEMMAMRADGTGFPAEVAISRITDAQPPLFTGYIRDLTERKNAEKALLAAQERLQHVVSTSPAVLYTLAVHGKELSHTWTSENITAMMGYPVQEAGVEWWRSNVHPDDMKRIDESGLGELFATDRLVNEYRFHHRDGSYRWIRNEMRLLRDSTGRPCEIVGSWTDIDDWKRLEEQYRQAQKMEGIGKLAGGVAHDFNNLLTIINGYSEMMIHQPRLGEATKNLLREIQKAGTRAAGLTQQLLAFSRKQILQPKLLDLNAVVTDTEKMLHRMIGEDVELAFIPSVGLARVMADPGQIDQVLINLAVNARDAMPKGGKLTLETGNVFLGDEYIETHPEVKPGPYVLLALSDTGCGMDKATRSQIFEPFFTTKEPGKGTGLGLATVFGIIKQSEGHIEVYSEVGIGTTFKIYLPAVGQSLPSDESHPGLRVMPTGTETLLLVEDEDGVRGLAKLALQSCGYAIFEAEDGQKALDVAASHTEPIHLLVTDVVMPRMSGREVAEKLTAIRPGMKVLFLSGYTDDAVVRHGIVAAEHHFLQKPFTAADLANKVRQVLDT